MFQVKLWFNHLGQVKENRKRGATKAAAKRSQRTKQPAKATTKQKAKRKTNSSPDEEMCHTCMTDTPPVLDNNENDIEWIECDSCGLWHHMLCVGATGDEHFYQCPLCFMETVM